MQVIASYLNDKYSDEGASFDLHSPEDRANDMLARRVLDLYISPIQARLSICLALQDRCIDEGC